MRPRITALLLVAIACSVARADVVTLRNGVKMTGILSEGEDGLTLRVSDQGYVMLDSATVVGIQRADKAVNAKLLAGWKTAAEADSRAEEVRTKYDEEQRAKGYVQYQGEWMTPSQFDRRLAIDRLEVDRLREERTAGPTVFYSYHYYYAVPSAQLVYQSFESPRRSHVTRRSSSYTVPLAPPGVRTYGVNSSLFDREAGMGAGAHYGW